MYFLFNYILTVHGNAEAKL